MISEVYPVGLLRMLLCIALAVTTYMATADSDHLVVTIEIYDKLQHLLAFYGLMLLADFSWPHSSLNMTKIMAILGYGAVLELIQHNLPYREFSWLDFVADGVGVMCYALTVPLLRRLPWLCHRWSQLSPPACVQAKP